MPEGRERDPRAVGRDRGALDDARAHGTLFEAGGEVELRAEFERDLCFEGDDGVGARGDRDTVDLPAIGGNEVSSVRREGVAGQEVARESRFLVVSLHRVLEPAVVPGGKVTDAEPGLGVEACAVDESASIRGQQRAEGAAISLREHVLVAGAAVAARYLPQGEVHVVGEPALLRRVVEEAPVPGRGDAQRVVLIGAEGVGLRLRFGDLKARAAARVVGPEFKCAQAGDIAGHDHALPIFGPSRRREGGLLLLRERPGTRAVGVHHPEVLRAVAIGDERDPGTVRREPRLRVEGHARRERLRVTPVDGERVQIARQFEDESASVRRDVERDPRAFVRLEGQGALGLEGQARLVPGRGRVLRPDGRPSRKDGGDGQCDKGSEAEADARASESHENLLKWPPRRVPRTEVMGRIPLAGPAGPWLSSSPRPARGG